MPSGPDRSKAQRNSASIRVREVEGAASLGGVSVDESVSLSPLFKLLFSPELGEDTADSDFVQPVAQFLERARLAAELAKSGTNQLRLPEWNEEISMEPERISEVNLSKRASGPGRIRLERTPVENGEIMIEGVNFRGECVSTSFVRE
jgi:hypothetical protein